MIYQHLFDRVKEPETVRAGIVGCGDFSTTIITQSPLIPRLSVPAVADVNVEAGQRAFQRAGIADDDIAVCDSSASALRSIEAGKSVVVQDASILMELPLDVIATATRVPEAGARYAYEAIQQLVELSGKSMGAVDWFFFNARRRCPEMTEPECARCPVDPVCAHRKELFQPVLRTTFY